MVQMNRTRMTAGLLAGVMSLSLLTGCRDSGAATDVTAQTYNVQDAIAPYLEALPEIPEEDQGFDIQMGYNDCDHMVAAIIGEETGLYEALGLNVTVTKTGQVAQAMAAGDMVVGYAGFTGVLNNYNKGAPVMTPAGSHLGGARYLVIKPEFDSVDDIVGSKITLQEDSIYSASWLTYVEQLGLPVEPSKYDGYAMSQVDSMFALKAGTLDAMMVCDPYASIAEHEGFGKIVGTEWGALLSEDKTMGWGLHCGYYINSDFAAAHDALTVRLVLAHCLSIKYMYEHPYSAAQMFAKGFGCDVAVGLRTMYLKTNAEGRTLCWTITQDNLDNYINYYHYLGIPEDEVPYITNADGFMQLHYLEDCGIELFSDFIAAEQIDEQFPIGMSYPEWLEKAETIDGIDHSSTVGKDVEKWMNSNAVESTLEGAPTAKARKN